MRVLEINVVCGYGSTGRIVVDLHDELIRNNQECCIAYGRKKAPAEVQTIKIGNYFDFYSHLFKSRFLDQHGFGSKRATKKLMSDIKAYKPDIIHLHNIHGYYINVELLFDFIKESNIPVIWTLHDCWAFTGHCAHFDTIDCQKWKRQCEQCKLKKDYPASWLLDRSRENYKRKKAAFTGVNQMVIVTPSKWLAEKVKESFLKEYEVITIPNGIDTDIFHPLSEETIRDEKRRLAEKYHIDFTKKIFLGVASVWTKEKGYYDFIRMSEEKLDDVQFVLVGVSPKQRKELPESIIGIERTENKQEMASLYACSDVFLNPTYADTFPTVNMEAVCCGTPVITYNTCGSPENILEGYGGVVEKGNVRGMIEMAMNTESVMPTELLLEKFDKKTFVVKYYHEFMKRR